MAEWLSIVGIGEDGIGGVSSAARAALDRAQVVFGAPRHLAMIHHPNMRPWPVPFDITPLLACKGQNVVALVSGDPFWFGAGTTLARAVPVGEWRAYSGQSVFSLMAARLGWALEGTVCLGLHARPMSTLRRHLWAGARIFVTLRDGTGPAELTRYLNEAGFGDSTVHVFSRLGGPYETVDPPNTNPPPAPVAAAIEVRGSGRALSLASGLADDWFDHDGQITKRPVRALALSALAPRPGELLWDIGTGSGSIAIEWLLSHPQNRATGFEKDPDRAVRAAGNAARFGVALNIVQGAATDMLAQAPRPDAVFIGGGADEALLSTLWSTVPTGCRIVAHAVTLETEALLTLWYTRHGGTLLRIELSQAQPLGRKNGWKSAYPVVQWQVTR